MKLLRFNESLTNIGNLKNAVQVMNWNEIPSNNNLKDIISDFYEDRLSGSDTYVRYYPNNNQFGQENIKIINYLIEQGFFIDKNDKRFYILIRINW